MGTQSTWGSEHVLSAAGGGVTAGQQQFSDVDL